jgi:putative ABC transport system permease protein
MNMELRPILSAMTRNKTGAILVALQVAIALAVVCNAWFITKQRLDLMARPSGYADSDIVSIQVLGYTPGYDVKVAAAEDLRALRALPGVKSATVMAFLPLGGSGIGWGFTPLPRAEMGERRGTGASLFFADEQGLDTLGMELLGGRWFRPEEMLDVNQQSFAQTPMPSIVVSKALADMLYPDGNAVGKPIYGVADIPGTIVGVVARAQGLNANNPGVERSAWLPAMLVGEGVGAFYVVRAEPGQAAAVQAAMEEKLIAINPRRLMRPATTMASIRDEAYRADRAMAITLVSVIGLLVVVTALGIFGLMAFNVNRRTKQIGTRRALGARKSDIVRHFLLESWVLSTLGAVLGVVLAVGLSVWLVETFQLPRLDWKYLPVGVVLLWLVGQLAAFGPARRAAAIPPAIATRNV